MNVNTTTDRTPRDRHSVPGEAGSVRSWGVTHTGAVRQVNQDRFLDRDDLGLWLVADGAGGHQGGGTAAQALVEEFSRLEAGLSNEAMVRECARALQNTHLFLRELAHAQGGEAMSLTTAVVLILLGQNLTCQWIGDSRAYRFRGGQLDLLTHDHSLVQEFVDAGKISASEAGHHPQRNVITRAVGADCDTLDIESVSARVEPGDFYLLCSDGLSGTLSDAEIAAAFDLSPCLIAGALIDAALAKEASDNVTAVVISVPRQR